MTLIPEIGPLLKTPEEVSAAQAVVNALDGLSQQDQMRALSLLQKQYGLENMELYQKRANLQTQLVKSQEELDAVDELIPWFDKTSYVLEKNDCSRIHKLQEAYKSGKVRIYEVGKPIHPPAGSIEYLTKAHSFVIKHDWSAALGIEDGEVNLPYDLCAFEFRISGRNVIAFTVNDQIATEQAFTLLIESAGMWIAFDEHKSHTNPHGLIKIVWDNIRAICIALDAEVATQTIQRAPHKLNEKRLRDGKAPLRDYSVVDLSRRHRIANPSSGESGSKKRLHFRRGHWRHFETSKTWVKWCLVGDPDLGFVAKHYTL